MSNSSLSPVDEDRTLSVQTALKTKLRVEPLALNRWPEIVQNHSITWVFTLSRLGCPVSRHIYRVSRDMLIGAFCGAWPWLRPCSRTGSSLKLS